MTFFDQILRKYAPTYTAVIDAQTAQQSVGDRFGAFQQPSRQPGDFVQDQVLSDPQRGAFDQSFSQDQAVTPEAQAAPEAAANPFDQFDAPQRATAQPAPSFVPARAAPAQAAPTPAPAPQVFDPKTMAADNGFHEVSPERAAAAEANRQHLALLINSGKSKAEIVAYLKTQNIDPATVTNLDLAIEQKRRYPDRVIPVGTADRAVRAADPKEYHGADKGAADAFGDNVGDAILFGAKDEIAGGLRAAANSAANVFGLGTGESFHDTYTRERDSELQSLKDSNFYHPISSTAGQVTGGLATAAVGGGEAAAGRAALRLAGEGAAYGGIYGFNSAEGDLRDRLAGGAKGAAFGGVLGATLGKATNAVAGRIAANRAAPSEAREILDAAERLNASAAPGEQIAPLIGHTSNGGLGSTLTAVAEPLILPGRLAGLERATRRVETNSGLARDRIANDLAGGAADDLNTVAARQTNPANRGTLAAYEAESRRASDALYTNAEQLAGDVRLSTPETVRAIDRKLAEWAEVPGGVAGAEALANLRQQLADGTWTVAGLRRLRTTFGDTIESKNRTVAEAAKALWPSLSRDITGGLNANNLGDAARAYRAADRNYATRSQNLDSISLILGDGQHSADTVADNISRMSRSDYGQLSRAIAVLPAEQQNSIRGAIVENLGRANPGKQDATGERFSLETFLSQWSQDKFSAQAKAAILPAQTVRDLNDLATLASANRALRSKGNPSRSGVTVGNISEVTALTTGAIFNPPALTAALAVFGGGKLLASPGFARALVRASESRSIEVFSRRLSEAARRNPALSQDILGFRDAVVSGKLPPNAVTVEQPAQAAPEVTGILGPEPIDPSNEPNPFDQFDVPSD